MEQLNQQQRRTYLPAASNPFMASFGSDTGKIYKYLHFKCYLLYVDVYVNIVLILVIAFMVDCD